METQEKFKHIRGWGIDSDPRNEPTYPMKNYTGDDHKRLDYEKPLLQKKTVEVLHSNERPSLSAVYGTSVPPSGLSGMLRRFAFRYSESSFGHWFPLIFADRINVVEGLLKDFTRGKIPNLIKEHGWKSEWQHNRTRFAARMVIKTALAAVVLAMIFTSSSKRKKRRRRLV